MALTPAKWFASPASAALVGYVLILMFGAGTASFVMFFVGMAGFWWDRKVRESQTK